METVDIDTFYNSISNNTNYDKFMHIKIYIDNNHNSLKNKYIEHINKHNNKIIMDPEYSDAGFDIITPLLDNLEELNTYGGIRCFQNIVNKIDFKIKCCAQMIKINNTMNTDIVIGSYKTGFYIYPRSSLSKTQLRLANNTGIIDAGYRGNLIGMFDVINNNNYLVEPYTRLLQICAPSLEPIFVQLVDNIDDLGSSTLRNEGGFGSSGR